LPLKELEQMPLDWLKPLRLNPPARAHS